MLSQLVSVIIPTYNRAHCLKDSIDSVLAQTYSTIEVLVVDDGSTDLTKELVEHIHDPRVIYIWQENAGACVARNHGVELAKGEIVAFHDSDDIWLPQKLETQVYALLTDKSDFCICQMESFRVNADGTCTSKLITPPPDLNLKDLTFDRLMGKNFVSTQMIVGKREVFLANPFDPCMPRLQDWELALRLLPSYSMSYVPEVLVRQYIQDDSLSSNAQRLINGLNQLEEKHKDYLDNHPLTHGRLLSTAAKSMSRASARESIRLFIRSFVLSKNPIELAHAAHVWILSLATYIHSRYARS